MLFKCLFCTEAVFAAFHPLIRCAVDAAYSCDPRIKKFKEEERARKESEKKAKADAKKKEQEEKERVGSICSSICLSLKEVRLVNKWESSG